ncbi:hypothetical protein [Mesorhizobium sp. M4B.F.Ca.ET.058.02.1.1]|uniref:hypothetical protein n=1 Tax=Mesorhizobium sp. M4B.F.Ca.ET.058.02.1.1 TaxID=2493675 RepID=UPI000F752793|nr:hypothetical protein [Mesorhizobium sp. M4B.F.Ca.ET.058.02.1.1]AZO48039.1 hypothetical protein EJ073_09565 [Mesorhizobium sp. M4B.F.Ca.ET.058.02.1.1]
MNLYHWAAASCLKEYSAGDIIVMAETIEDARQKAYRHADIWIRDQRAWWFNFDGSIDREMWQDSYDGFYRLLKEDLAQEPDLITPGVVFIRGSE